MRLLLKRIISLLLLFAFLFVVEGCKKEDPGIPPEIPPESSFVMDFSDFEDDSKALNFIANDYSNYQRAVAHVVIWNIIITVHLAVPVATFVHSFDYTPQYQDDEESWLWTYDVIVGNNTYTAELYGKVYDTYVRWDMYVSKSGVGSFSDFHWYYGESNINNTGGEWTLYKSPTEPHPFVGIDWNRNVEEGIYDITYMNIVPDGPENGGYISHGYTNDELHNAFYDIYIKGEDNLVEINWHRTSMKGNIKDPAFFGDDEFYCWDELLLNTECE